MERITIDSPASVQFDYDRDRVEEAVRGRAWLSKQVVIQHQTLVTRCLQVTIGVPKRNLTCLLSGTRLGEIMRWGFGKRGIVFRWDMMEKR